MKRKFNMFISVILFFLCLYLCCNFTFIYANSNIDITSSSVRDDLESMDMDKLSYLSDTENIFITMSQYYDNHNKLRSYLYFNYIGNFNQMSFYVELSTSVMDSDYNIVENYQFYELSYVNHEESWFKYEILNLSNLEDTTRRYNINSIGYYEISSDLSTYTPVFSEISQTFIYNGISNNSIQVFHQEVETITITDKVIAFYCYGAGDTFWFQETDSMNPKDIYTDSWFVFFNTDKKIDELLEFELTYTQYDYHFYRCGYGYKTAAITEAEIESIKNNEDTVYYDDFKNGKSYVTYHEPETVIIEPGITKVSYIDKGWFGKYIVYYETLDNIMNLKEYQEKDNDTFVFTEYANEYNWGVHFTDTTRQFEKWTDNFPIAINYDGSGMSNVAIFRLKFMTSGIIHNCYAVDTPTSDFEGNSTNFYDDILEKILMLIGILVLVIIFGALSPVFGIIFKGFIEILKFLVKGIFAIVSLPFKIIKSKKNKRFNKITKSKKNKKPK